MYKSRYRRILWFFARVLIGLGWWDILFPKIGFRQLSHRTRPQRLRRTAANFRVLAVEMGGVMIKVGQFLSSRLDVMPREITDELSGLQDEVRPETFSAIRQVIETEFGAPLEQKYCFFEEIPMASASIGQVHRALLCVQPGESSIPPVVVKVQRPNIEIIVKIDLDAIKVVGKWVNLYPPVRKRVDVSALLGEFSRSLYEEIDYLAEGKNAETFAANFSKRTDVRVPHVYWSHVTRRVLTLEDVQAIKITDYAAIEAAGIDRIEVSNRLFDTYLKQIFEDRFFHADPHPGNLFILPLEKDDPNIGSQPWRLVFVDFGMVGRIHDNVFDGLREVLLAVGLRDPSRIIKGYQLLDVLLPSANLPLLEKASARVFDSLWGKSTPQMMSMDKEEAQAFIDEFGELMFEMPFQLPENLILLGRTLGILSGMCSGLNPEFNLWTLIIPYASKLVESQSKTGWKEIVDEIGGILRTLISLPHKTENLFSKIEQGQLEVRNPELQRQMSGLSHAIHRLIAAIIFAALLISGIQLFLAGQVALGRILIIAAFLSLLWLFFTRK